MAAFQQTEGRAFFMDGVFQEPRTLRESAERAGKLPGGKQLVYRHMKQDHCSYELHHDAEGGVSILETRGPSAINPTADSRAAESATLKAINARNAAYWDRQAGR